MAAIFLLTTKEVLFVKVKDTLLLMLASALVASVATLVLVGSKIITVSKKLV